MVMCVRMVSMEPNMSGNAMQNAQDRAYVVIHFCK